MRQARGSDRAVDAPIYHDYGFSCGGRVNYDATDAEDEYGLCVDQYPGP